MSEPPPAAPPALPRFSTGIPGLDIALGGGLLRGGLYLVEGQPGAGKTILGNQLAFAHVAAGGRAVYVTLLTEAHSRMLGHLRPLTFYDEAAIGDALVYLSGTGPLEEGGLPALLTLLHAALRQRRATLLVVDGLAVVAESAEAENPLRRFMVTLQSYMESIGGVALLLGRPLAGRADLAHTMVDGVLALRSEAVDVEVLRTAEVVKFRGAAHLRGRHAYAITDAGLVIYPRTEARYAAPAAVPAGDPLAPAASVGLPRLDAMLGGGLPRGAAMLVAGGAGTGKTPFGLHFLDAGARAGEAGLYFGFGEPPAALLAAAAGLGLTLRAAFDREGLAFVWQLPGEEPLDALAERLLAAVARQGARRLVLDGLDILALLARRDARLVNFWAALQQELRRRGVTTVATLLLPALFGAPSTLPIAGLDGQFDTLLFLHTVERHGRLDRLVSVLKARGRAADRISREFRLTDRGIQIAATADGAEAAPAAPVREGDDGADAAGR